MQFSQSFHRKKAPAFISFHCRLIKPLRFCSPRWWKQHQLTPTVLPGQVWHVQFHRRNHTGAVRAGRRSPCHALPQIQRAEQLWPHVSLCACRCQRTENFAWLHQFRYLHVNVSLCEEIFCWCNSGLWWQAWTTAATIQWFTFNIPPDCI